jgi:hypothetical protein
LRTTLGHAAERAEALQASYNSSEQELQELRNAALETCRVVEEGEAQAGSSLASHLRALGGHVTERIRRALSLGVQKALGVVRSHYEVNFEALAEGYVRLPAAPGWWWWRSRTTIPRRPGGTSG